MIFYKITQSKNSLSKEGETLYFAKTIITGKTDFNELCDKVNKLSKIDKSVSFLAECENGVWLTHFLPSDTFLRNGGFIGIIRLIKDEYSD